MITPSLGRPSLLVGARLPRWILPPGWPLSGSVPALADLHLEHGRVTVVQPSRGRPSAPPAGGSAARGAPDTWLLDGRPVLPGLVDAHTHLDKAFTAGRAIAQRPGLLGAIEAMHRDRLSWTAADVHERASRGLDWAHAAGVVHVRTHVDWWEADTVPVAWRALERLAAEREGRVRLERVALVPLGLCADATVADTLARHVAAGGAGTRIGGFVHTSNWSRVALEHLFAAADAHGLDVDLHVDEELDPRAGGLAACAEIVRATRFGGRVVCGHACAIGVQDEGTTRRTLDAVAAAGITLVALPLTNLLLQDAIVDRTPRRRGLTLVKEARARGIPVLVASDNVQDSFCALGSFDPVEALHAGVLAGQLDAAFDTWSETICRVEWLLSGTHSKPLAPGSPADLVLFTDANALGWPSRAQPRVVVRGGMHVAGALPASWKAVAPAVEEPIA
jgi:cytosine deaminase